MPFGLVKAPASVQKTINALVTGFKGAQLQAFIDDLCLASASWDEHLELLEKILHQIVHTNLKLNAKKCVFATDKVNFLGHEISQKGIKQQPEKLKALTKLDAPTNADEVRRVLGMFVYYRKFVPNFSLLAEPLTRLTKKKTTFVWNDEQATAFDEIKRVLASDATLGVFNHTDPVCVKTDASRKRVAGILLQLQKDTWRLITCCSRRLSSPEENYGLTDLEGLVIIYTVTKLRPYLLGKYFDIITGHCALCVRIESVD